MPQESGLKHCQKEACFTTNVWLTIPLDQQAAQILTLLLMVSETVKTRWYSWQHLRMIWLILVTYDLISVFGMVYINSFLRTHSLKFLTRGWTPLKGTSSVSWFVSEVACDHALPLYLCNLFSGGGHDFADHKQKSHNLDFFLIG